MNSVGDYMSITDKYDWYEFAMRYKEGYPPEMPNKLYEILLYGDYALNGVRKDGRYKNEKKEGHLA